MKRLAIIGGGAAGMFCAAMLENARGLRIDVLERSGAPLQKVLASGGGRCNFTNLKIDFEPPKNFYPRGASKLRKPLRHFGAAQCAKWFREAGVEWREEDGGRVFPKSGRSSCVASAILRAAKGARIFTKTAAVAVSRRGGEYEVLARSEGRETRLKADFVLVACGGIWTKELKRSLEALGHSFAPPAPSLFAMRMAGADKPGWEKLAGISAEDAALKIAAAPAGAESARARQFPRRGKMEADIESGKAETDTGDAGAEPAPTKRGQNPSNAQYRSRGALLFTHFGISGPAALELSSRAARLLQDSEYRAEITADFLPSQTREQTAQSISKARTNFARSKLKNANPFPIPARLWEGLILPDAGIDSEKTWANLSKSEGNSLAEQMRETKFECVGRAPNKGEFVTCGGLNCDEADFSKMESKICPNLFFAGECLDIDAITGGFNLQAAWTTAKICADAIAARI